jgi:hypothetical protein
MTIDEVVDELLKELKGAGVPGDGVMWSQSLFNLTQAYCQAPELFTLKEEEKKENHG